MSEPTQNQNKNENQNENDNEHDPSPAPARRRPLWIAVAGGLLLLLASVWRICA